MSQSEPQNNNNNKKIENIFTVPLVCINCNKEHGATLHKTKEIIDKMIASGTASICKDCFEQIQKTIVDYRLPWGKMHADGSVELKNSDRIK